MRNNICIQCYKNILRNTDNIFITFILKPLDGLGDFNIGGQIIQTVKYADDLVLMTKEKRKKSRTFKHTA